MMYVRVNKRNSKAKERLKEFIWDKFEGQTQKQNSKVWENAPGNSSLQIILYIRIKGREVREVHEIHWWHIKEVGESKAGKHLGFDKKQNGYFFYIGWCKIVNT